MPAGRASPTQSGLGPVRFMQARVTDVDTRRYTVTVLTEMENREYPDLQCLSPYWHYQGEGMFVLPDIDARCMICIASDDTPPFIVGFLDIPSMVTQSEVEAQSGLDQPQETSSDAIPSFTGAKPRANLGDMGILGRDGNFTFWRKGGVLQEGASAFCQRVYIPIRNQIRDYAENYSLVTVGGDLLFESDRLEDSSDATAGFRVRLLANEVLSDKKASVYVGAGRLGDDILVRVAVAPGLIDRSTGAVESPVVDITFGKDGQINAKTTKGLKIDVTGTLEQVVTGTHKTSVTGRHELTATDSTETITGVKKIAAASIQFACQIALGDGGKPICGNAIELLAWLTSLQAALAAAGIVLPPPPEGIIIPGVTA
jgi:hypothetical protein